MPALLSIVTVQYCGIFHRLLGGCVRRDVGTAVDYSEIAEGDRAEASGFQTEDYSEIAEAYID